MNPKIAGFKSSPRNHIGDRPTQNNSVPQNASGFLVCLQVRLHGYALLNAIFTTLLFASRLAPHQGLANDRD
jgi:hypothetical protein